MASEWYYTTNKQQMGPVSWDELRELADVGILKPHDMVWADGMKEWIKAINQDGLFEEGGERPSQKAAYTDAKPPPGRRTRRREVDEEDEEDRKAAKKKNREREQERAKMAVGVKIGLIIAGVLIVLVLGLGCTGGLIWVTIGGFGGGPKGPLGKQSYVITNLRQKSQNDRRFNLTQGRRVIVTVTAVNRQFPNTDVDLHVIRGRENFPLALDERVPPQAPHCRVEFNVPATDSYTIRVRNLGPGTAGRCEVVVDEQ